MRNTDTFDYIGQFSAGVISDGKFDAEKYMPGIMQQPGTINKNLKLIWFSCGTKDIRYQGHLDFVAGLKKQGFRVEFHEMPYGHEW